MQGKFEDLTGRAFGRLVVIEKAKSNKNGRTQWLCKCDCGNQKIITQGSLKAGLTRSCGCFRREKGKTRGLKNRIKSGEAAFNSLYSKYRYGCAEKRGFLFELTKDEFRELTSQGCYYCGKMPQQSLGGKIVLNGSYIYNGIDRIDSSKGYTIDNCVTCCKWCNWAKRERTQQQFLDHCRKIVEYQEKKNI